MAEITLVRQEPVQITEADKAVARRVECANLHRFTVYDGLPD